MSNNASTRGAARAAVRIGGGRRVPGIREAGTIELGPLDDLVGFHIHVLDVRLYQIFYERLAGRALTPGVFSTLLAIRENPGVRHGALADALMIQRPNMTTLINRLEREGYVSRRPSPDDKRWVVLFLTAKGERAVAQTLSAIAAHDRKMTSALSPAERTALLALLRKLGRSLPAPRPAKNGSSVRPAMPE